MVEGLDNLISNERSTGYKGLLMNKLVKIWSGESYYIEDVGMEASVDLQHKKMHLPLNTKDWQALRAYGQHESAHVLFTDTENYLKLTKDLFKKYDKDKVWRIINAFEDRRVEYLFSKIYAGAESEFRDSNTEALKELLGKLHTLKPLDRIIVQIGAYMINGIRPENKDLQVLAEEVKKEIESKWIQQSVVDVSGKVLDYLDKYLAKRKKEREDAKAKERIRTSGEKKDEESSEGTSDEGDKSEGDGESDEPFDIDKFLDTNEDTEKSKEDTEKTKDDSKPEKREGEHKEEDLSGISEESEKEDDDKDGDDGEEDYENEEDLKTEEEITGKKEKIEKSRFKSKTRNKKSIEKAIKKRRSVVIDDGEIEKKDPFRKLTKNYSYIPVRKLIKEEEIEKDNFTEIHRQYYENVKNKNIGLIRRLRTNLVEIKNAVEIQESKGGIININRSISMIAQSGRPAFTRAVENTNRNVSLTFLLDQSGSMLGEEIMEAREALIILSEVLNGLHGFEFAMFGFCSADSHGYGGKDYHTMKTFQYKGFSTRRTDLIASARVDHGNRDGYHIRVVRDYIQQHADVNAAKFLVVLTDGVPQDDKTEYVGQIALNDTMKAIQEVESQFPVIGVLFGDPSPGQQHLYKNRVHCALDRLSEGLEELVLNIQQQIMRG